MGVGLSEAKTYCIFEGVGLLGASKQACAPRAGLCPLTPNSFLSSLGETLGRDLFA